MTKPTPGKLAGLKAVSDARGVIAAAAMDQRGSLKKSLAKEKGVADLPDSALVEFKELVTDVLTRYASAILLDPEFGLPASKKRHGKGLLLAYEKTGYDADTPGRLPDLLDHWSVRRLKEAGADCVKVLLYYTPFEKSDINDRKHAFIERIGDECRAHDIAYFLEFVGYDVHGNSEKSLEYALKKPEIVSGSMAEFGKEKYLIDVLKVEVPVQMELSRAPRRSRANPPTPCAEALHHFQDAATMSHKPFIYLSAGVSNAVFTETLELAARAGPRLTVCSAAGLPGRMASPFTPRAAPRLSKIGSTTRGEEHPEREQESGSGALLVPQGRGNGGGCAGARLASYQRRLFSPECGCPISRPLLARCGK